MPRVRSRNAYQYASEFDKGRIVAYWDCGLLYCSISARVGRDPMTGLNSARYISGVLRPLALTFIRVLQNPTFKLDNARPHVAGIVRTFLDTENVRLLPWTARLPDLSPIKNIWSMVAMRLDRHHTPVATVDELWYLVEAARSSVPVHAVQSLFDSMPRRISAVITARGGRFGY
ncbi:transposable element Tcb1 transposase [Trichonephila clavipes]|nr:transposable element Tcb1 transposase [Trichonephila clavipes]